LVIILLTALPPAPPAPNTVIRGFSSRMSGIFKLMLMCASSCRGIHRLIGPVRPRPIKFSKLESSEAFPQPSSDPSHITLAHGAADAPFTRFEMFEMSGLRIDEQPRRRRKGRPLGFLRQSGDTERTPDAHRPSQHLRGEFDQSIELARTACQ